MVGGMPILDQASDQKEIKRKRFKLSLHAKLIHKCKWRVAYFKITIHYV